MNPYLLAFSGSLRTASSNAAIVRFLQARSAPHIQTLIFDQLGQLPHFNPDLDIEAAPAAVADLRQQISGALGVIICTPEYAFGIPGVLKNALDWLVSSGELNEKPVFCISASPLPTGGNQAMASLLPTCTALGVQLIGQLSIPALYQKMNPDKQLTDPQLLNQLDSMIQQFISCAAPN